MTNNGNVWNLFDFQSGRIHQYSGTSHPRSHRDECRFSVHHKLFKLVYRGLDLHQPFLQWNWDSMLFISSVIVLVLIVCKAYQSVLQRLFFYLMVATATRELFLAASIEHHFEYSGQDKVCTWIAFIYNWTGIVVFVHTVGIMIYLFFLVRYLAKGNTIPQVLQSRCRRIALETLYIVLSVLLTFAYASVPYFTNNYGLAGAWCWIRALDENCKLTLSGLMAQLFHGHIFYESGGIVGIILMIATAVIYYRLPVTLKEARLLLKKTFIVMMCFLLYVVIVVIALSIRMITAKNSHYQYYAIWFSVGITYPISLLLFPVAFLLCFYPVNKLCRPAVCAMIQKGLHSLCRKHNTKNERTVRFQQQQQSSTHIAPTFPESTRVSPPSSTFFQVPYTNNFTRITTENAQLITSEHMDTGYGSVSQQ